jgi:sec-independent protein translocase protein TatC
MDPSIWDHVKELRKRLLISVAAVVILAVFVYVFSSFFIDKIIFGLLSDDFVTFRWLCKLSALLDMPSLCWKQQVPFSLINTEVSGQFRYHIMISLLWGIILAFPFILYQFWIFLKPALFEHELKVIRRSFFWMFILFLLGVVFSYFVLIPFTLQFLLNYQMSSEIKNMVTLHSFFSTVFSLIFWMGLSFEIPWVMFIFAKVGLLSYESMKKYRAFVFVIVLIIAGIITPTTDMFTQFLVTLPLYGLFEIGLYVMKRQARKANI